MYKRQEYNSDKLSCLPLQFTITNVFYNKDAFEAAGLEVPTVDDRWTMDEVYEAAAKLMADGGVKYGMAVDFSRARYDNLMYMNGGSMVEKDGDSFKVAINSQANIDTLQTFVDKNNEGIMPKAIWAGGSTDNPGDYFKNGDVGMYFSGSWNYNAFTTDITGFESVSYTHLDVYKRQCGLARGARAAQGRVPRGRICHPRAVRHPVRQH